MYEFLHRLSDLTYTLLRIVEKSNSLYSAFG
jgi:hypothetical protein